MFKRVRFVEGNQLFYFSRGAKITFLRQVLNEKRNFQLAVSETEF